MIQTQTQEGKKPFTVLLDVDDVAANLLAEWISRYNRDYYDTLELHQIRDWDIAPFTVEECGTNIYNYLRDTDLYDDVKPHDGAVQGVNALRAAGFRIVFVTSTNNEQAGRKLRWLSDWGLLEIDKRGYSADYIEAHDKSLILGDVLLDDRGLNLQNFTGHKLLFDRPHNHKETAYTRVHNWFDAVAHILALSQGYAEPKYQVRKIYG